MATKPSGPQRYKANLWRVSRKRATSAAGLRVIFWIRLSVGIPIAIRRASMYERFRLKLPSSSLCEPRRAALAGNTLRLHSKPRARGHCLHARSHLVCDTLLATSERSGSAARVARLPMSRATSRSACVASSSMVLQPRGNADACRADQQGQQCRASAGPISRRSAVRLGDYTTGPMGAAQQRDWVSALRD